MEQKFFKAAQVSVNAAGYLNAGEDVFITNPEFVELQNFAHKLVVMAEKAKTMNFKAVKVNTLADLNAAVEAELAEKQVTYFETKAVERGELHSKLADEALNFLKGKGDNAKASKMNDFMQKFNTLKTFEDHGLFFTLGITKLNRIYTTAEITAAVKSLEENSVTI